MSFERLHLIGRQANSVLYKGNVYPCVKYLVRQGDEAQCEQELAFLLSSLRDFTDIHLVVSLLIERPFPRLDSILRVRCSLFVVRCPHCHSFSAHKQALSALWCSPCSGRRRSW